MWIAREKNERLFLFEDKPEYGEYCGGDDSMKGRRWHGRLVQGGPKCLYEMGGKIELSKEEHPEVTFENSPVEIDLKCKFLQRKKLYLSGPMSVCKSKKIWEQNFQYYENLFKKKGYEVVNPAKNPVYETYEECLRNSLLQEMECDCIFFLSNAILSDGARLEYDLAKACGLEIVTLDDDISFTDNYAKKSGLKPKKQITNI